MATSNLANSVGGNFPFLSVEWVEVPLLIYMYQQMCNGTYNLFHDACDNNNKLAILGELSYVWSNLKLNKF